MASIKRSPQGLRATIVSTGVVALVLAVLCSWLIGILLNSAPSIELLFKVLIWLGFLVVWAGQSAYLWHQWDKMRYDIGPEAITINNKTGLFGQTSTIYRYESIISAKMTQGYLGKKYGYGNVYLRIPKLEYDVVLKDIDNPEALLAKVQERVNKKGTQSHSLIH